MNNLDNKYGPNDKWNEDIVRIEIIKLVIYDYNWRRRGNKKNRICGKYKENKLTNKQ
jgi:hypothetical protein